MWNTVAETEGLTLEEFEREMTYFVPRGRAGHAS